MSFILDALKKSEREREQQLHGTQPGPMYGRRSHAQPIWMFAVMGLLLVNLGFLLVLWMRSDHQAAVPMITVNSGPATAATSSPTPTGTTNSNSPVNNGQLRSLQDEAAPKPEPDETAAILANAAAPEGPQLVKSIATDAGSNNNPQLNSKEFAAAVANASTTASNNSRSGASAIPTLDSLGGNGALNLPPLHLDIHVYSANNAERFVFINMHKYVEGQNLTEGPTVERITPEGAVLSYRNQRFMLARQ